jgi:hypothetical protein
MKPQDHKLGTFAPPRPDFQTGGFTPLSRRRSQINSRAWGSVSAGVFFKL